MKLRPIIWRIINLVLGSLGFLLVFSTEKRIVSIPIPNDQNHVQMVANWKRLDTLTKGIDSLEYFEYYVSKINESINILSISREEDSLRANILDNISKKWIYNKPAKARECLLNALQIRKRLWPDSLHKDIKRIYYNLGVVAFELKDYHQAITFYDSSGQGNAYVANVFPEMIHMRKGETYSALGEYSEALYNFDRAFEKFELLQDVFKIGLIEGYLIVYRKINQYKLGIAQLANLTMLPSNEASLSNLNIVLGNIWGDSLIKVDDLPLKLSLADSVIKYYNRAGRGTDQDKSKASNNSGLVKINLAEVLRRVGLADKGEAVLESYLHEQGNNLPKEGKAHFYLTRGEIYQDQLRFEEARKDYDSAAACLYPTLSYLKKDEIPPVKYYGGDKSNLMTLMDNMARLQLRIHEQNPSDPATLERGINWYDSLFQFITFQRGDLISDEAKLDLAEQSQPILTKAIQGCIRLYQLTKKTPYWERAFNLSEQSKTFSLLEASRLKNLSASLPQHLRELERSLYEDRSRIESELAAHDLEDEQKRELRKLQSDNLNKIREFLERLKAEQAYYYNIKYRGADLSISALQQSLLAPDQALVEYYYTDSSLCIFVMRKDAFEARFVPISRGELETKIHAFTQYLQNPGQFVSEVREGQILELSRDLYTLLWAPIAKLLPERVIIVPHGALNTLPFEALNTGGTTRRISEAVHREEFLLQRHAFSSASSANLLYEMKQIRPRSSYFGGKKTALLQTDFHKDLSTNTRIQALNDGLLKAKKYLVPLGRPQDREITAIQNIIRGAKVYRAATKENFMAAAQIYPIIHVATHGILNERDPSLSFISFTQVQDTLNLTQLLFIKDFKPHNWRLDLVFFSACQTASGRYRAGEGNISMARGLTTAGVRSFVSTLWDVPVDAKAKIAPEFYNNYLKLNKPKDISLALAKRKVAKEYPDPAHWSGYVLIGASD